jgi:hypothetical protein
MNNRRSLSVDELDLLVRAIHREWKQDPTRISINGDSTFYKGVDSVHLFMGPFGNMWVTISAQKFECVRPNKFFDRKNRKKFDTAAQIISEIRGGEDTSPVEALICEHVPSAKDIIAERALIDDHKEKP